VAKHPRGVKTSITQQENPKNLAIKYLQLTCQFTNYSKGYGSYLQEPNTDMHTILKIETVDFGDGHLYIYEDQNWL
jgi:hypothetical protein